MNNKKSKSRLSTEKLVKTHLKDSGFGRVETIHESYYILVDGTYLGCNYDCCGMRGDDHRMIFGSIDCERNDWDYLHKNYRVLRFMPEGWCVWVLKGQRISPEQMEIIEGYGLEIVRY